MTSADITDTRQDKLRRPGLIATLRRNVPLSIGFGMLWLVAMVLVAIFADQLRPYGITAMDLTNRLAMPGNAKHWLGTDELGRDVLARLIQSVRVSRPAAGADSGIWRISRMEATDTRAEMMKIERQPSGVEAMKPPNNAARPEPPQDPIDHIDTARWRSAPSQ